MLIRSQNKESLVNMSIINVLVLKNTIICQDTTGTSTCLGTYESKAKALKVLGMIQEAYAEYKITCTFLTGFTGHRAIVESNKVNVNGFEELVKNFKKNMIFQLPEDSEVKE